MMSSCIFTFHANSTRQCKLSQRRQSEFKPTAKVTLKQGQNAQKQGNKKCTFALYETELRGSIQYTHTETRKLYY